MKIVKCGKGVWDVVPESPKDQEKIKSLLESDGEHLNVTPTGTIQIPSYEDFKKIKHKIA